MQRKFRYMLHFFILFMILFISGLSWNSHACNVPVFRYALERWRPDVYKIVVYYQEEIDRDALSILQKSAVSGDSLANFSLKLIDVSTPEGKFAATQNEITKFPWFEVYYPENSQVRGLVWDGLFHLMDVKKILHSHARSTLAKNLLKGDAAVWVFLKSGDSEKDEKAFQILKKNLERASTELKIPATGVDIDGNPIDVTDFKDYPVHFSLIEIAKNDSDEVLIIKMLSGSESDLQDYDAPLAFPVIGRGRALYALIGNGINEQTIGQACRSIINWCSCEVKASNPGIDLLISADWSKPIGGNMVKTVPLPPLTGLSKFIPDKQVASDKISISAPVPAETTLTKATIADSIISDSIESLNESAEASLVNESNNSVVMRNIIILIVLGFFFVLGLTI
ncbi:hypothetical protein JW964_10055, partial [candidate division KSB1 bacterium]|nr:hypothetical protein [candidate division KSB1 bacterium]